MFVLVWLVAEHRRLFVSFRLISFRVISCNFVDRFLIFLNLRLWFVGQINQRIFLLKLSSYCLIAFY